MSIKEREKGFEQKFAHDEELMFKAQARRAKLVGLWAAEKLGLSGLKAEEYAKSLVIADLQEAGEEDVFAKIRSDFDAAKVDQSDHQIRREMADQLQVAMTQIHNG